MIKLGFIVSIAAVVTLNFKLCFSMTVCARAEYEVNGECCPMCAPGNHVYWHCTIDTSTTCVPCPPSTYTDEPNGLDKCFPCSVCDAGQGLRVKRSCTRFADTVCEPLEGFYCIEQNKGSCRFAVKHSECDPGQYIRQAGTAFTDTDCGNCSEGTYSNGSFTTCQPHSKCEAEGLTEIKPGTVSSDAECGSSAPIGIIAGATTGVVLLSAGISLIYFKLKHKQSNEIDNNHQLPVQECGFMQSQCDSEPTSPDSVTPLISFSKSPEINRLTVHGVSPHSSQNTGQAQHLHDPTLLSGKGMEG
ncbi:tumor necrosis factor receptor superfamily member 14-like [Chanodichthys erythropterus]|uniref:tumor necrosis factor receptor superfamily member 14-like n=1 Tax=Chanodichthys erythropterus TaxID=933992 RepID=UPI00351E6774